MSLSMPPGLTAGTSCELDQLFAAPEVFAAKVVAPMERSGHGAAPSSDGGTAVPDDLVDTCRRGEMPPGRMPRLAVEHPLPHPGERPTRNAMCSDLAKAINYLDLTHPRPQGLVLSLRIVAGSAHGEMAKKAPVEVGAMQRLLRATRFLSQCLDAREGLAALRHEFEAARPAWDRAVECGVGELDAALKDFDAGLTDSGLKESDGSLSGQIEAVYRRLSEAVSLAGELVAKAGQTSTCLARQPRAQVSALPGRSTDERPVPAEVARLTPGGDRRVEQLLVPPAIPASSRTQPSRDEALAACLRGELPAGSLPRLAGEDMTKPVDRAQFILDLDEVVRHFATRGQHAQGLGAFICWCAAELAKQLRRDPRVDDAHARSLLAGARRLSQCLDARENWGAIVDLLGRKVEALDDPLLRPRWRRLLDLSKHVGQQAGDAGVDAKRLSMLRWKHMTSWRERTAALADATGAMLSAASTLSSMAVPGALHDKVMRDALSQYEGIVALALRRAASGDAAAQAALDRRIATHDGMRWEVLLLEGQMSAMREALVGASPQPVDAGAAQRAEMIEFPPPSPPSSCSSFSSSDNEGVPDPRNPVQALTDLFERG
ncbi:hypothetical protein CDL60_05475 [Roseateles noduli]|nr:hypothetical protein CDL60_05475 [Roseateles noduli]